MSVLIVVELKPDSSPDSESLQFYSLGKVSYTY